MEKSNLLSPSTSTQLNNIQIDITLGRSSLAWAGTLNESNCRLYRLISLQSNVSELSMSGWLWQFARQFRASGLQVCTCIGTDGPGDRQIRHHASWDTGNRKLRREVGYRVTDKVRESSKGERKHPLTLWRQSSSKLSLTSLVSVLYIVENNIAWNIPASLYLYLRMEHPHTHTHSSEPCKTQDIPFLITNIHLSPLTNL